MRHLSDITSIEELIYSDAFTIQAYDEFGNMMWDHRFPSMLIQSYYANNSTFVLIRNTRSMHAGRTTNLDGVRLLDYSHQVEDHVLLASLDPSHSTSDLPLLGPLYPSREEMGVIPSKGNTDLVEPQEVSHGVVALKDWTYREGVHPFASAPLNPLSPLHHLIIFLTTVVFVIIVFLSYRYFCWLRTTRRRSRHLYPTLLLLLIIRFRRLPFRRLVNPKCHLFLRTGTRAQHPFPWILQTSVISMVIHQSQV